jgi:hypothetical protein
MQHSPDVIEHLGLGSVGLWLLQQFATTICMLYRFGLLCSWLRIVTWSLQVACSGLLWPAMRLVAFTEPEFRIHTTGAALNFEPPLLLHQHISLC